MCKVKRGHVKVVNNVAEAESEQYEDLCSITPESVNKVPKSLDRQSIVCCVLLRNNLVKFKLDCGATCNIIPTNLVNPNVQIEETDQVLNKKYICDV